MNFLIDAELPPALAQWIKSRGHEATHVFELGFHNADDSTIWQHARKTNAVVVSKDEDFVDRWLMKPEGVALVWIRKGNCSNQALMVWLEPLWPDALKRLQQGERLVELRA